MSASPSGLSNNQTPTPNGGPPQYIRRKPANSDPLRPRKKPVRRPNVPKGPVAPAAVGGQYPVNGLSRNTPLPKGGEHDGWTYPPEGQYKDYPVFTTKRALRERMRYHIMRLSSKKDVDPTNQNEFLQPVTLHRRDPNQPAPGKAGKDEEIPEILMDSKEREKLEIAKAEKEAKRAADLAQIAPSGNNAAALAKKNSSFRNEKTTQVHRMDKTAEQKKASDLRYEEALPWHLEDAESKNTWVGNYEAALSGTNVVLVNVGDRFLMIPIEKWYKFSAKNKFTAFTIEEAEAKMGKKIKESRWVMKDKEVVGLQAPAMHKLFTVKSEAVTAKNANKSEMRDVDDLDFDENDLFQDDDEQATVEPDNDEEVKEAQAKIKREQQGANIFDQNVEEDVEKELLAEFLAEETAKKIGKKTRKALTRRERNLIYESDSDHPYSESSEDDTSDEEKQAEIDKRKDEEAKSKLKTATEAKLPSGASSKGTNTPSGRTKTNDLLKKPQSSLKRPGSPNLSESSGNESSRKKQKKYSSRPSGANTPMPGSRPISPAPSGLQTATSRKSSVVKLPVSPSKVSDIQSSPPHPSPTHGSSMSDAEATGGEMSDGGKRKIKLKLGGTPSASRAGSPIGNGSRAGSPAAQVPASAGSPPPSVPITLDEVRASFPPEGITINGLMKAFAGRVGSGGGHRIPNKEFIKMIKETGLMGTDKLLRRRQ